MIKDQRYVKIYCKTETQILITLIMAIGLIF